MKFQITAALAAFCLLACGIDDTSLFGGAGGTGGGSGGHGGSGGASVSSSESSSSSSSSSSTGGFDCNTCSDFEFCANGTCEKTLCQKALEDANVVPTLDASSKQSYLAVLNCVCHDPSTSSVCGSNLESQTMCGNNGWDTGNITQDFLSNNPIGGCCSQMCDVELTICRGQL